MVARQTLAVCLADVLMHNGLSAVLSPVTGVHWRYRLFCCRLLWAVLNAMLNLNSLQCFAEIFGNMLFPISGCAGGGVVV